MQLWMILWGLLIIGIMYLFLRLISKKIDESLKVFNIYSLNMVRKNKTGKISFKSSFKGRYIPIIQIIMEGNTLNFLLDTGANINVFNKSIFNHIYKDKKLKRKKVRGITFGDGKESSEENEQVKLSFQINEGNHIGEYTSEFDISDMDAISQIMLGRSGLELHGILGAKFFAENNWKLDFEELVIWLHQ
jgi:hypothetical protein